jgi:hypothetical protein
MAVGWKIDRQKLLGAGNAVFNEKRQYFFPILQI